MGAGHQGAAAELARRLTDRGHRPVIADFLDAFPGPLPALWEGFYRSQLRYAPSTYESSYQMFYRHPRLWEPFVAFERTLAGRRLLAWVKEFDPDVIVSTYSFATLVLGRLRQEGALGVPVVNFLTDFGVHPRAVHPSIDLNLALHAVPAEKARSLSSGRTVVAGPAVPPSFREVGDRRATGRAWLGLARTDRVVVVVAGSWGVGGKLADTVTRIAACGRFKVVTVCGLHRGLRRQLERRGVGIVLGWTDRMPELLAAADVVVENAGGLTSLEAFAAGVPIVTFRPIPGHGRDNASAMASAGVTSHPGDEDGLVDAIDRLTQPGEARDRQVAAGHALFCDDPVDHILALAR
jgi:UDP-N-acetylglucosamine:LPS N-acetylglucosamine transferase